jgi:hypothetical protein
MVYLPSDVRPVVGFFRVLVELPDFAALLTSKVEKRREALAKRT